MIKSILFIGMAYILGIGKISDAKNDTIRLLPVGSECVLTQEEAFPLIGQLKVKPIRETHNDLTIGCEVLDRDYADYEQYKSYLDSLGMHKIRLQAGWAKSEKVKGRYDFRWLDRIVDDAIARGLTVWMELSYGNPIYQGGGTPFLKGGWPTSTEGIQAWNNWVRAMAVHYKGRITQWEIWNEPDINKDQIP